MLGCTVIHVHANMVERQLQSMLYIDRVSNLSSSRMKIDCFLEKSSDGRKSVGKARVCEGSEKQKKYSTARKIMA